jgi:hypothetical protein
MTVTITIDTDNEAFRTNPYGPHIELNSILRDLATKIAYDMRLNNHTLRDSNGNTCGQMTVTH